jgi:hypothetical protein
MRALAVPLARPLVWSKLTKNHLLSGKIEVTKGADSFTSACSSFPRLRGRP